MKVAATPRPRRGESVGAATAEIGETEDFGAAAGARETPVVEGATAWSSAAAQSSGRAASMSSAASSSRSPVSPTKT